MQHVMTTVSRIGQTKKQGMNGIIYVTALFVLKGSQKPIRIYPEPAESNLSHHTLSS